MAKLKIGGSGEKVTSNNSGAGAGKRGGGGGSRGRGRSSGVARHAAWDGKGVVQPKKGDKCKYCGNWAKECRSRLRDEAHLAQVDEDDTEPALLMARGTLTSDPLPPRSVSPAPRIAGERPPLEIVSPS
jgi:hypothetical protein